jgi:hypothetical protein
MHLHPHHGVAASRAGDAAADAAAVVIVVVAITTVHRCATAVRRATRATTTSLASKRGAVRTSATRVQGGHKRAHRVAIARRRPDRRSAASTELRHQLLLPLLAELVQSLLAVASKLKLLPRTDVHPQPPRRGCDLARTLKLAIAFTLQRPHRQCPPGLRFFGMGGSVQALAWHKAQPKAGHQRGDAFSFLKVVTRAHKPGYSNL